MKGIALMAAANAAALAAIDYGPVEERILAHMDIPDHVSIDSASPHFWPLYADRLGRLTTKDGEGHKAIAVTNEGTLKIEDHR